MTIPTISTLPTAPARTDAPATFITRADAFLAAIVVMQGELNTSIGAMNTDIAQVNSDATAAAASATAAASSATAAANAAGAALWVSGQAYAEGDAAISLINYQTYRAETATSGTTDPSLDANWTAISGTFPDQTSNAGKFLTTDGTDTSWAEIEVPTGTFPFTASGSITAGDTVALNNDDTVSTIFTSGAAGEVGTGVQWRSSSLNYASISYGSNTDSYAYFGGGSSLFGCSVVNVSGVTVSTSGFAGISSAYTVQNLKSDYSVTHDRHLAFFTNQSASDQGVVFVGRDNGSVLNTGTFTNFPLRVDTQNVVYDPTSEKFIAIYKDLTTTGHLQVRTITTNSSDNSVSFGSAATITTETSGTNKTFLCYDPDSTKVLSANREDGQCKFRVLTVSGTSISVASPVTLGNSTSEPSSTGYDGLNVVYDTANNRFIVSYKTSNSYLEVAYGTISGTTTTWSTPVRVSETQINFLNWGSYNPTTGQLDVFVVDSTGSNYSWAIDISTATPTVSKTANVFQISANDPKSDIIYDSTNDVNVLMMNNYAQAQKVDTLFENADRFYGLAASSAADGETVELNLESTTNENQSGLSINQGYWVAQDGSLSTTDTGYPFVGYGVAADKLFLSHLPVQTGNSGKFLTTDGASASWGVPSPYTYVEQSLTGVSSFTFSGIPAGVKQIIVAIKRAYSGGSNVAFKLGDSGGLVTSGYNGITVRHNDALGSVSSNSHGDRFKLRGLNTYHDGVAIFTLTDSVNNYWSYSCKTSTSISSTEIQTGAGGVALSGDLDRIYYETSSGNFDNDATIAIIYS